MIVEKRCTVFNSGCEGLINTVNCKGVMGAGLALEFRMRYPDMFRQYETDCKEGLVRIGEIRTYRCEDDLVINFPTKDHWREPSEMWYIEKGLDYLVEHYKEWNVKSIAVPPLGCSNGHLNFDKVRQLIIDKLSGLDIDIIICTDCPEPEGKEKEMVDGFVHSHLDFVCDYLDIQNSQRCKLKSCQKSIKRFYQINSIDGVGINTYEKLFRLFYSGEYLSLDNLEVRMFERFVDADIESLCERIKMSDLEKKLLIQNKDNISCFSDIGRVDGLKYKIFKEIFNYCKDLSGKKESIQTKLI